LSILPPPVKELYQLLTEACTRTASRDENFDRKIARLATEFKAYAAFFESDVNTAGPSRWKRTWRRWKKSFRKRFPSAAAEPARQK